MADTEMLTRPHLPIDENTVAELWRKCDLIRSWDNPTLDIERKLEVNPELFLVGLIDNTVIAATRVVTMGTEDGYPNLL